MVQDDPFMGIGDVETPPPAPALKHLRDHLSALAFCEETNQRAAGGAPPTVYKR
ncbi:hypothetical protein [Bradyrhizobium sp. CCBAU 21362]|uniref:hypothetical protein n=1 Tax=Bradyrhizobium sp. CCBAU 21362 TaxID=1325082 RepID=UPI002304FA42|nr:hypothetical protein [Bradyrhizobium sp. CCBAU 21362]